MYHDKCTFWAPQNPTHTAAVRVEEDAAFCDYFWGKCCGGRKKLYICSAMDCRGKLANPL